MITPKEDFNTIIEDFNNVLSNMGPGMGDPVTRGERALLKTFYLFMQTRYEEEIAHASSPQAENQNTQ